MRLLEQRPEVVAHVVNHVLVAGGRDVDGLGARTRAGKAGSEDRDSDQFAHMASHAQFGLLFSLTGNRCSAPIGKHRPTAVPTSNRRASLTMYSRSPTAIA